MRTGGGVATPKNKNKKLVLEYVHVYTYVYLRVALGVALDVFSVLTGPWLIASLKISEKLCDRTRALRALPLVWCASSTL